VRGKPEFNVESAVKCFTRTTCFLMLGEKKGRLQLEALECIHAASSGGRARAARTPDLKCPCDAKKDVRAERHSWKLKNDRIRNKYMVQRILHLKMSGYVIRKHCQGM
jgi:hypothetical protein